MELLLIGALLPAIILMIYIYRKDSPSDREPGGLLLLLFVWGAISCAPAALAETVVSGIMQYYYGYADTTILYNLIDAFLVVGIAEEGCKRFFLRRRTWNNVNFNCSFDGIVYAVFVSLGFAALENVGYVLSDGIGTMITRALLSVPGHATFGVYMGVYYSRAKRCEAYGRFDESRRNMRLSLIVPVLLHGFYDFCLFVQTEVFSIIFFIFVIALDVRAVRVVNKESREDSPIVNWGLY